MSWPESQVALPSDILFLVLSFLYASLDPHEARSTAVIHCHIDKGGSTPFLDCARRQLYNSLEITLPFSDHQAAWIQSTLIENPHLSYYVTTLHLELDENLDADFGNESPIQDNSDINERAATLVEEICPVLKACHSITSVKIIGLPTNVRAALNRVSNSPCAPNISSLSVELRSLSLPTLSLPSIPLTELPSLSRLSFTNARLVEPISQISSRINKLRLVGSNSYSFSPLIDLAAPNLTELVIQSSELGSVPNPVSRSSRTLLHFVYKTGGDDFESESTPLFITSLATFITSLGNSLKTIELDLPYYPIIPNDSNEAWEALIDSLPSNLNSINFSGPGAPPLGLFNDRLHQWPKLKILNFGGGDLQQSNSSSETEIRTLASNVRAGIVGNVLFSVNATRGEIIDAEITNRPDTVLYCHKFIDDPVNRGDEPYWDPCSLDDRRNSSD